jgi:hypothetical protein
MPVLEANDRIVGIPHDDHIALGMALAPLLDPEIVDIMEVHFASSGDATCPSSEILRQEKS